MTFLLLWYSLFAVPRDIVIRNAQMARRILFVKSKFEYHFGGRCYLVQTEIEIMKASGDSNGSLTGYDERSSVDVFLLLVCEREDDIGGKNSQILRK